MQTHKQLIARRRNWAIRILRGTIAQLYWIRTHCELPRYVDREAAHLQSAVDQFILMIQATSENPPTKGKTRT